MPHYDLAVVGAGSTGFHAARIASSQGKSVALIEGSEQFGGLCILRGCMPTKTMLRSAEIAQLVRESSILGVDRSDPLNQVPGLEEAGYITSDNILDMPELPQSLLVLGGGAIAVEFAQLFCRLGVNVTVIQRSPLVLSKIDSDISKALMRYLEHEGVSFVTETQLEKVELQSGLKTCTLRRNGRTESYSAEEILLAVGRQPAIAKLNCANAANTSLTADLSPKPSSPTPQLAL